jgi:hypothetical protein
MDGIVRGSPEASCAGVLLDHLGQATLAKASRVSGYPHEGSS